MRLSTLLPLTLLALATATPLPSSLQDGALKGPDPTFAIIDPIASRSIPTTDSNLNAGPVTNKRGLNSPNAQHDPALSRSTPIDDMALVDNSLNDVFILKKRGFWAKLNKWYDCDIVTEVADNDGQMDSGYCS